MGFSHEPNYESSIRNQLQCSCDSTVLKNERGLEGSLGYFFRRLENISTPYRASYFDFVRIRHSL
jgi:hypothetical protein